MASDNSTSAAIDGDCLPQTSFVRSVTGTYVFDVIDYRLMLRRMDVGEYVSSGAFSVGGFDWEIRFYPDGLDDECGGNTSAYVILLSRAADVRAKFTMNILEKDGDQLQLTYFPAVDTVFSFSDYDWGHPNFVKEKLRSSSRRRNSEDFTIRCSLAVVIESAPLELPADLGRAFRDRARGADVTFLVGGREFPAHRFLLAARSPVFDRQLFGPMMEKDLRQVRVVDMDPAVFEMLLRFVYTDSLEPAANEMMRHLLVAADRYGLDRLKLMCAQELCSSVDANNVTALLALADQRHCKQLKDVCLRFMASPDVLATILDTGGFKYLLSLVEDAGTRCHEKEESIKETKTSSIISLLNQPN